MKMEELILLEEGAHNCMPCGSHATHVSELRWPYPTSNPGKPNLHSITTMLRECYRSVICWSSASFLPQNSFNARESNLRAQRWVWFPPNRSLIPATGLVLHTELARS